MNYTLILTIAFLLVFGFIILALEFFFKKEQKKGWALIVRYGGFVIALFTGLYCLDVALTYIWDFYFDSIF